MCLFLTVFKYIVCTVLCDVVWFDWCALFCVCVCLCAFVHLFVCHVCDVLCGVV